MIRDSEAGKADDCHIAYCGLDCKVCPAFLFTRTGDEFGLEETAKRWSEASGERIDSRSIACDGCKSSSSRKNIYCARCPIATCAKRKGYETCAECKEFPCPTLASHPAFDSEARSNLEKLRKGNGEAV